MAKLCLITGKHSFSREDAEKVREKRQAKEVGDKVLRKYPCEFCGLWHLTHKKTIT